MSGQDTIDLLLVETNSIGDLYYLANLADHEAIRVLEFIPSASTSYLICTSSKANLESLIHNKEFPIKMTNSLIGSFSKNVINAFLGLANAPLKTLLYVIESEHILDMFKALSDLTEKNFDIVDFRVFRGSKSKGFAIVTSEFALISQIPLSKHLKVTEINKPSEYIKSLFA